MGLESQESSCWKRSQEVPSPTSFCKQGQRSDQIRYLSVLCILVLKTCSDGGYTTFLDYLFCLTILRVKRFSLHPAWTSLVSTYASCLSSSHPPSYTWWWRAWICLVNYLSIGTGGLLLDASWLSEPGFLSSQFRCSTPPQLSCLPPYCLYQRPEASLSCGLIRAEKMGTMIYSDSWPCFFCYSPGCFWPSSQQGHMDGLGLASCSPRLAGPFQQCCYGIYKLGWE